MRRVDRIAILEALQRPVTSGFHKLVQPPAPARPDLLEAWRDPKARSKMGREQRAKFLHQNDAALAALIAGMRSSPNNHHSPENWYQPDGSSLYDNSPSAIQLSLIRLRGLALKLTRQELADYCGISAMTIYRQESTNWCLVDKVPCWLYWVTLLRWSRQCWGHMPTYRRELVELENWCELATASKAGYLEGKANLADRRKGRVGNG